MANIILDLIVSLCLGSMTFSVSTAGQTANVNLTQQYCHNEVEVCGDSSLTCEDGRVLMVSEVAYKGTYWCRQCVIGLSCFCRQDVHHNHPDLTRALARRCDGTTNCTFIDLYQIGTLVIYYQCTDKVTTHRVVESIQEITTSIKPFTIESTAATVQHCAKTGSCSQGANASLIVVVVPVVAVVVFASLSIIAILLCIRRWKTRRWNRGFFQPPSLTRDKDSRHKELAAKEFIYTIHGSQVYIIGPDEVANRPPNQSCHVTAPMLKQFVRKHHRGFSLRSILRSKPVDSSFQCLPLVSRPNNDKGTHSTIQKIKEHSLGVKEGRKMANNDRPPLSKPSTLVNTNMFKFGQPRVAFAERKGTITIQDSGARKGNQTICAKGTVLVSDNNRLALCESKDIQKENRQKRVSFVLS